jgi:choline dehydrogenase
MWPEGMDRDCAWDCDRQPSSLSMWMHHASIVGGNTMHNLGFWLRGDCEIYATWGEDWSCENVLATFDQIEDMYASVMRQDDITNAPRAGYNSAADEAVYQVFVDAGYTETTGRSVGDREEFSVSWTEWTNSIYQLPFAGGSEMTTGSSRVTVAKVFIDPLRTMSNFNLHTNTKAMKLNFDGSTCTGITACSAFSNVCQGDYFSLTADETMIALGSVTTAQLLLVSGVGPAADLEELGIDVVADLPVGETYQNHVFNGAMYCAPAGDLPTEGLSYFPPDGLLKGVTTTYPTTTANVWAQGTSSVSPGPADYSTSFISNVPEGPFADFFNMSGYGDICADMMGMQPMFVIVGVMYAHSNGHVTIASDTMNDYPVWQPGMLTNDNDATILYEAFAKLREILVPAGYAELFPGESADTEYYSIYGTSGTFWHDSSTTPIGTVLGSDLKVMGIEGLRVCDSSMQPWLANMPPTAIIQAAGLMGATIALREAM